MLFTNDKNEYRQSSQHLPASPVKPMSVLTSPMSSPASLKRSYADTGLEGHLRDQMTPTPSAAAQGPASSQAPSPSPSPTNLPMPTSSADSNTSATTTLDSSSATVEMSNKRTKLTFAEKESRQIEKQFKEQQKAEEKTKREEEKAKKWEEKARKDDERRVKDAEKEERKKAKEEQAKARGAEKQRKLEEKQKAEEEKNKKARSQLRLNAFFVQPSMPNGTPNASPAHDAASPLSSRRSSIADIHAMEAPRERSRSVSVTPQKVRLPDYDRQFPPFFLQSHTVLAPHNRFSRDEKGLQYAQTKIDDGFGQGAEWVGPFNAYDLMHLSPGASERFPRVHAVKDVIAKIHGSARNPIDLTESQIRRSIHKPTDLLRTVSMKYLKFFEDYRPPYTGTFTKVQDRRAMSRLSRKPFSRELPSTDYDYDSEAEWEEPEEGEDLESEGEEEVGEDEEENEMEGFLDDEENGPVKKRPLLGDLEPTCSGICWEDLESEDSKIANLDVLDLSLFKLDILMENPQLPIDPYSTSYWKANTSSSSVNASPHVKGMLMEPPRIPLNPTNRQNTLLSPSAATAGSKDPASNATAPMKPPIAPKRLIPLELMEEFKKSVDGNELTKLGLLEVLKKQFPKQPKAAIRDTLDTFAERIGAKEAEKKWMLKSIS